MYLRSHTRASTDMSADPSPPGREGGKMCCRTNYYISTRHYRNAVQVHEAPRLVSGFEPSIGLYVRNMYQKCDRVSRKCEWIKWSGWVGIGNLKSLRVSFGYCVHDFGERDARASPGPRWKSTSRTSCSTPAGRTESKWRQSYKSSCRWPGVSTARHHDIIHVMESCRLTSSGICSEHCVTEVQSWRRVWRYRIVVKWRHMWRYWQRFVPAMTSYPQHVTRMVDDHVRLVRHFVIAIGAVYSRHYMQLVNVVDTITLGRYRCGVRIVGHCHWVKLHVGSLPFLSKTV